MLSHGVRTGAYGADSERRSSEPLAARGVPLSLSLDAASKQGPAAGVVPEIDVLPGLY